MQAPFIDLGSAQIYRLEECIDTSFLAHTFFPQFSPEQLNGLPSWLLPHHYQPGTGALVLSMHSWIVKTARHTVLIDACIGNDKERMPRAHWHHRQGDFLQRLAGLGFHPHDIDLVMCTHMHADHVGWNTVLKDGRWVPTFPKAQYLFSQREYEHASIFEHPNPIMRQAFNDSVLPVVESGQALMIQDGHEVDDMFSVQLAPGHTPGNAMLRLHTPAQQALFVGDVIHHPLQVYHPELSTVACLDPQASHQSRLRMLHHCCEHHALMLPAHFAAPHGGFIEERPSGLGLRWLVDTAPCST
jgi:glyoxylase-like metal-dependent hydrolase (beta-lactamase superfamily II)